MTAKILPQRLRARWRRRPAGARRRMEYVSSCQRKDTIPSGFNRIFSG
jgi:hypothetical protein